MQTFQDKEVKLLIEKMESIPEFFIAQKKQGSGENQKIVYELVQQNKTFFTEIGFWLFEQQVMLNKQRDKIQTIAIVTEQNNADINPILDVSFYGFDIDFTLGDEDFQKAIKKEKLNASQEEAANNLYAFRLSMKALIKNMYGKIDVNYVFKGMERQFKLTGKAIYPQEFEDLKTHCGKNIAMDMYYLV